MPQTYPLTTTHAHMATPAVDISMMHPPMPAHTHLRTRRNARESRDDSLTPVVGLETPSYTYLHPARSFYLNKSISSLASPSYSAFPPPHV
eukprot:44270-Eustigmatos_ZCMA.PRE.1